MYVIIKQVKNEKGVLLPVILLDAGEEIWEFSSKEKAEKMAQRLELNSDSGYHYEAKEL